jgi:hypothetical protein
LSAHLPVLRDLPPNHPPFGFFEGPVTAEWLARAVDDGKVPDPPDVSAEERASVVLYLGLSIGAGRVGSECHPLEGAERATLERGDSLSVGEGTVSVTLVDDGAESAPREVPAPARLTAIAGPLDLVLRPAPSGGAVRLCN